MPRIIVGYGEFKGCTLLEVSKEFLNDLSRRFPLESNRYDTSDGFALLITVAIREEIDRRDAGGRQKIRVPSLKEMATKLVGSGYRQLSKRYHPDLNGLPEEQLRLTQARDALVAACDNIVDEDNHGSIVISDPSDIIDDADIPF
jgi:hypothetical protein